MNSVKNYIQENKDRFIAELIELLKMLWKKPVATRWKYVKPLATLSSTAKKL